jgi:1-phosphofructokinase
MKIITVTLNPSLDRVVLTHYFNLGYHNRTTGATRLDPGGRGVNITRALHKLNCDTRAVILMGNDATGRAHRALVSEEGFPVKTIMKEGRTRSNITIVDTGNRQETRLIEESEGGTESDIEAVAQALDELIEPDDLVVLAGSLPESLPIDSYATLTERARAKSAIVVLAARGANAISQGLKANPDVAVLGRNDLEGLFNFPVRTSHDVIYCAQNLREQGVDQVLVTMLNDGTPSAAALVTDENIWMVETAPVEDGTQDGINDALLAGFLTAWSHRYPSKKALELGAAAAIYTATKVGSEFGTFDEIKGHRRTAEVARVEI